LVGCFRQKANQIGKYIIKLDFDFIEKPIKKTFHCLVGCAFDKVNQPSTDK